MDEFSGLVISRMVAAFINAIEALKDLLKEQIKKSDEVILEIATEDVNSLSWKYESETLSFHKDDKWVYDDDEAFPVSEDDYQAVYEEDTSKEDEKIEIEDSQSALESLEAQRFTNKEPDGKEEISLTIYLDNENYPEVTIELYRYDVSDCMAVVDGEPVSLVARDNVVDLIEAVNAIVLN